MVEKKLTCYRIKNETNEKVDKLAEMLDVNKGDIVDKAIDYYYWHKEKENEMKSIRYELDEIKTILAEMTQNIKHIQSCQELEWEGKFIWTKKEKPIHID